MKTRDHVADGIIEDLKDLLQRYQQLDSMANAGELHGTPYDEKFVGNKIQELETTITTVENVLSDLSYIE